MGRRNNAKPYKSDTYKKGDDADLDNPHTIKRGARLTAPGSSAKHPDAYLDELEWRFNNRDNPWLFRDTLLKLLSSPTLEYKTLTN